MYFIGKNRFLQKEGKKIEAYLTISEPFTAELSFKKSRFIACLYPAADEEKIELVLEEVKERFPKATHYCIAAVLRQVGRSWEKMSDDGEPSGTAGKPILDVLRGSGLTNAVIIVVRYFGGTLLGTGGLVRAYSDTAKEVLKDAVKVLMTPARPLTLRMDYTYYRQFENKCRSDTIGPVQIEFLENVTIKLSVHEEDKEKFIQKIMDLTHQTASVIQGEPVYVPLKSES